MNVKGLLCVCIWNYSLTSVSALIFFSLTFLLPGNVHRSQHLHRQHGGLWHPPLLLHHALHPAGCHHKALDLWTQHGQDNQTVRLLNFLYWQHPRSRQSIQNSYRFKANTSKLVNIAIMKLKLQEILCKLIGSSQSTCVFFSSFSILLIAIDRYLFIVRPAGRQISVNQVTTSLLTGIMFTSCLSFCLVLFSTEPTPSN